MATEQVLEWLKQTPRAGYGTIAIAVVDRALARRVRARLEQSNVLIDDRTGWRISTTRAAAWISAWIEFAENPSVSTLLKLLEPHWYGNAAWLNNDAFYTALHSRWVRLGWGASWPTIEASALALANEAEFIGEVADSWHGFANGVAAWLLVKGSKSERTLNEWAHATLRLLQT
jgi:hypothetical protein